MADFRMMQDLPTWNGAVGMLAGANPMGKSAEFIQNQMALMEKARLQKIDLERQRRLDELQRQKFELDRVDTQRRLQDSISQEAFRKAQTDDLNRKRKQEEDTQNAMRDASMGTQPGMQSTNPVTGMAEVTLPRPDTDVEKQARELDALKQSNYDDYSKRQKDIEAGADRDADRKSKEAYWASLEKDRQEAAAQRKHDKEIMAAERATARGDRLVDRVDRRADRDERRADKAGTDTEKFWDNQQKDFKALEDKYSTEIRDEINRISLSDKVQDKDASIQELKKRMYEKLRMDKERLKTDWAQRAGNRGLHTNIMGTAPSQITHEQALAELKKRQVIR